MMALTLEGCFRRLAREGSLFGGFVPPMLQEECTLSTPQVLRPARSPWFYMQPLLAVIFLHEIVQDQVGLCAVVHCS